MKRLTIKENKFTKDCVETGNATEAAARNYNVKNRKNATKLASLMLQKPHIQRRVEQIMEQKEITDDFLMDRLKEGLDANIVSSYKGKSSQTEIPDMSVRHKYWQDAAKIREMYPAEKHETRSMNLDIQLETMPKQEFLKLLKGEVELVNKELDDNKTREKENPRGSN